MAIKFKYKLIQKVEDIILNKRVMLLLAIMAPVMFTVSALYLGGYFGNVHVQLPKLPKFEKKTESLKPIDTNISRNDIPSIFKEEIKPLYGEATTLQVPSVGLELNLQSVGLDSNQALEAPKDWQVGGWYKYGARPGELGNIIIDGHYDDNYGKPAAFWQLKNIKVDDKVLIEDRYGKTYTYTVTESFLVSINDPNRLQIFEGDENHSLLTLVTCGGVWVPGRATYDKRLVVKAELDVD